ncbi:MAG: linear amide C-N hydrolase [Hyphomonadaceae bacterium]|nr:linear amide C-N hydrolase [Hyphomonadaceae bacterium]
MALLSDTIIAGGDGDFMSVRHLVLRGSNHAIGRALADVARDDLAVRKTPWTEPMMSRAQRAFLARNWPSLFARMHGVAAAFGATLDDDTRDFSFLAYDVGVPGCSCIAYPPQATADGHAILSRNFDYTLGGHTDMPLGGGSLNKLADDGGPIERRPYCARPFLLELHPDDGYPTLGMCAFDLLGQLTDGVNSEGLCVALLNDNETAASALIEPFGRPGVGLSEGHIPRFLLETCADVDEAKEALLAAKQYYVAAPCHYLIADRHGRSFVWEYSPNRNRHFIIESSGAPLPVTNHLLHEHAPIAPEATLENSQRRLAALQQRLGAHDAPLTRQQIRDINSCVAATDAVGTGQYVTQTYPGRTLWYACYDLTDRKIEIDFYLGEHGGGIRRSAPRSFGLS